MEPHRATSRSLRVSNTGGCGRWHDKSAYQREHHSEFRAYYTVLAGNYSSAINATILTDDNTASASGNVSIRIVNASPVLAAADVYVLAPGSSLGRATAAVSNLNFESASSYQSLSAGSYEVYFTQPGQTSAIIDSRP
jgi:hypothetical protein